MNSFYSMLYGRFASLQVDQSFSASLVYPAGGRQRPFLKVGKHISDCIVGIPPVQVADGSSVISYGPFRFQDSEFGRAAAIKLAVASTCLLSAKSAFYWLYHAYIKEWLAAKADMLRASYVINVMLDLLARQRIRQIEGEAFYNDVIRAADALAALLLLRGMNDIATMAQRTLTSFLLNVPVRAPSPVAKVVRNFLSELGTISLDSSKIVDLIKSCIADETCGCGSNGSNRYRAVANTAAAVKIGRQESGWDGLAGLGDTLYDIVITKIPGKWHNNYYLPYSHALVQDEKKHAPSSPLLSTLYSGKVITEQELGERGLLKLISCAPSPQSLSMNSDQAWQEIFFELVREEKLKQKMLAKLSRATRNLNFNNVGLPASDYVSYYRLYSELSPHIRRMIERARLVKNVLDENMFEQSGNVDLQAAIQAIASEQVRNDMFFKDENLLKDESWTILVDSSLSLNSSSKELKAISICLAETAREIIGANTWGMFAFSDNLYCLKDFTEPYDNDVKARIGGLTPSGLSYIPDAIRACRMLASEHSKERNYIILVSDGVPSGYPGIEKEFASAVKELTKYGFDLAAMVIGGSGSIKKTVRRTRIINEPAEILKEFTELYFSLSS